VKRRKLKRIRGGESATSVVQRRRGREVERDQEDAGRRTVLSATRPVSFEGTGRAKKYTRKQRQDERATVPLRSFGATKRGRGDERKDIQKKKKLRDSSGKDRRKREQ